MGNVTWRKKSRGDTYWFKPSFKCSPAFRKSACASLFVKSLVVLPFMLLIKSPSLTPCWAALLPGLTCNENFRFVPQLERNFQAVCFRILQFQSSFSFKSRLRFLFRIQFSNTTVFFFFLLHANNLSNWKNKKNCLNIFRQFLYGANLVEEVYVCVCI